MRGRFLLLAGCCIALGTLLPGPDATVGRPRLARLLVCEWLTGDGSPLRAWVHDGRAPRLQVELRQSPPVEDEALRAVLQQQYERSATDWATERSAAGQPTMLDARRGTLVALVRVGTDGVRAELSLPDGSPAVFEAALPSRGRLLFVYFVAALLFGVAVAAMLRRTTWSSASGVAPRRR